MNREAAERARVEKSPQGEVNLLLFQSHPFTSLYSAHILLYFSLILFFMPSFLVHTICLQGKVVFSLSKCLIESVVIGQIHHQLLPACLRFYFKFSSILESLKILILWMSAQCNGFFTQTPCINYASEHSGYFE